jgi:hypothetical protein
VNGHGEYELQSNGGYCVRASDGEFDNDLSPSLFESGATLYDCLLACNADE